jgi:hypothetical protein
LKGVLVKRVLRFLPSNIADRDLDIKVPEIPFYNGGVSNFSIRIVSGGCIVLGEVHETVENRKGLLPTPTWLSLRRLLDEIEWNGPVLRRPKIVQRNCGIATRNEAVGIAIRLICSLGSGRL